MPRPTLVAASLTVHFVIVIALFIAGFWRIDRLDSPRHRVDLAVAPPPPPAPAGSPAGAKVEIKHKQAKQITHDIVVPPKPDPEVTPTPTAETDATGDGNGSGSGSGSGSGDPDSTGDCVGDCGDKAADPQPKAKEPVKLPPVFVPPKTIKEMRIAGETQIQPPDIEKTALLRSGTPRATATLKVCVGDTGNVVELSFVKRSGYAGWDGKILAALQRWRYRPHKVGERAVTVCGMVTFVYEIH